MELLAKYGVELKPVTLDQTKHKDDVIDIDFKDRDGKWVLRFRDKDHKFYQTRLGKLHNNMSQRAKGNWDKYHKGYTDVGMSPLFADPQAFCEWAVRQKGWGLGYHLDKDLLGGRQYSEDSCLFLPGRINTLIGMKGGVPEKTASGWVFRGMCDGQRYKVVSDSREDGIRIVSNIRKQYVVALATQFKEVLDERVFDALAKWEPICP